MIKRKRSIKKAAEDWKFQEIFDSENYQDTWDKMYKNSDKTNKATYKIFQKCVVNKEQGMNGANSAVLRYFAEWVHKKLAPHIDLRIAKKPKDGEFELPKDDQVASPVKKPKTKKSAAPPSIESRYSEEVWYSTMQFKDHLRAR